MAPQAPQPSCSEEKKSNERLDAGKVEEGKFTACMYIRGSSALDACMCACDNAVVE